MPHTLESHIFIVVHQAEVRPLSRVQAALPGVGDGVVAAELQKIGEIGLFIIFFIDIIVWVVWVLNEEEKNKLQQS